MSEEGMDTAREGGEDEVALDALPHNVLERWAREHYNARTNERRAVTASHTSSHEPLDGSSSNETRAHHGVGVSADGVESSDSTRRGRSLVDGRRLPLEAGEESKLVRMAQSIRGQQNTLALQWASDICLAKEIKLKQCWKDEWIPLWNCRDQNAAFVECIRNMKKLYIGTNYSPDNALKE
eukprot:TRINITY_DN1129_c1_g1_i1.p1 TRINITY_DN1129_c1_g1~~TRINITY_DN1129_c1_g1_i1.p1  ORF type:complete len:181 (-),score=35.31 TRINITY_DN1129_c1_g1_i1:76-618(-)